MDAALVARLQEAPRAARGGELVLVLRRKALDMFRLVQRPKTAIADLLGAWTAVVTIAAETAYGVFASSPSVVTGTVTGIARAPVAARIGR
jgi:hypothetical protein